MRSVQKMVVIPVVMGVILCIVSFFALRSTDAYLPIGQGTVLAYHNSLPHKADDVKSIKENSIIGSIELSKKQFNLVFENDYSNMKDSFSMLKGSNSPNEYGCVYVKTISSNADAVSKSSKMSLKTLYGNFNYKLADSFTENSEYKIMSYSPRAKKSVIVFYQMSNGTGISSDYEVYVFEEVQ